MSASDEEATTGIALALSGGGFRAALFHAGVLRRLAELGLLGRVKVISCVSGGSIAGAVYYLSLLERLLAPGKRIAPNEPLALSQEMLTDADYGACVARTQDVLKDMARANVRATVFRNPWKNATMFLSARYSRTDRAGDMLDGHIRRSFGLETGTRGYGPFRVANQIELRSLHVVRADVPRLVLNATTLNTGHAWRFDTDGMGELLSPERRLVDKNALLQWTCFDCLDALGSDQAGFPYGVAIAASAAFPGLFRPLPVGDVYPGYRVDLMDGGAQDNQGTQSLRVRPPSMQALMFDRLVVSDGAGQMRDEPIKRRSLLGVSRILGIQGDRIREEQLLSAQSAFGPPRGRFDLLDLRHDLPAVDVPAAPDEDAVDAVADFSLAVREALAGLRTDLDAFGELETTLLERRGYQVAATALEPKGASPAPLTLAEVRTRDVLEAASKQLFKPFAVFGAARLALGLFLVALVLAAGWSLRFLPGAQHSALLAWAVVGMTFFLLPAVLGRVVLSPRLKWPRTAKSVAALAMYAALIAAAAAVGPSIAQWGDADLSHRTSALVGAALLGVPPVMPAVLWLLLWLEGLGWRRLARLPAG